MRRQLTVWIGLLTLGFVLLLVSCGSSGTNDASDDVTPGQCTTWEDCADDNPCTQHECVSGQCVTTGILGKTCDDQSVCTSNDQCTTEGVCEGTPTLACDDGDPCTDNHCDAVLGCVNPVSPDGTSCDDGLNCTLDDQCLEGLCTGGSPVECADETPEDCFVPQCEEETGECLAVLQKPQGSGCEDGDACTGGDSCNQEGTCEPGEEVKCKTQHPCKTAICHSDWLDEASPCEEIWKKNGALCDDLDVCTILDVCVLIDGELEELDCIGTELTCPVESSCQQGYCETGVGCSTMDILEGEPCGELEGHVCHAGLCECAPQCEGKDCGADGCGGQCGECEPGLQCWEFQCIPDDAECSDGNDVDWDGCSDGQLTEVRLDGSLWANVGYPDAVVFSDGTLFVVWEASSALQAGAPTGIVGQFFLSNLTPMGNAFRVDVNSAGSARYPRVTISDSGRFMVVWQDDKNSGDEVRGRVFEQDGTPLTGQFDLTSGVGEKRFPDVVHMNGGFVAAWQRKGLLETKYSIRLQRYSDSGVPIADNLDVNSQDEEATRPVLAETQGGFILCFELVLGEQDGVTTRTAACQLYDFGAGKNGSLFYVWNGNFAGNTNPAVVDTPSGGFLVAWLASLYDPNGLGSVNARSYTSDASSEVGLWTVDQQELNPCWFPSAAFTTGGSLGIAWGQQSDIWVRLHASSLAPSGAAFQANVWDEGDQTGVVAVGTEDGNLLLVWATPIQVEGVGQGAVFARRFSPAGEPLFH